MILNSMIKPLYLYKVYTYNIVSSLNKLKSLKVKIYNLKQIDQNTYTFYSSIYCLNRIKSVFYDLNVIKQTGYFSIFLSFLKYKTTLVALVISLCFYFTLSNKIWIINITGDSQTLNEFIKNELLENKIYVGAKKIDNTKLSEIQKKILFDNFDTIEYLSLKNNGSCIDATYKIKRVENEKNKYKKSLYASKDGMIKSFDILSGEKAVEVNDYVKKGDLLVKDIITTDYNEQIYIGTYGSVYAYTWYYVTIQSYLTGNENNADLFANTLLHAKNKLQINFSDNEYIYEENVLQFNIDKSKLYMKIHFTCVEDIAKE